MTWLDENPFPSAEGSTVYEVLATWRGERCSTRVIGMPRVHWTMNHWNQIGHDDIRFKEHGYMSEVKETKPEMWAVVEITGHKRIAGKISEETKFGVPMMRVDVPKTKTHEAFVRYFGGSSIHSFTPMDEATVRRAAEWLDESPSVLPGVIESPMLAAKNTHLDDDDYYNDDLDDPDDDYTDYSDDSEDEDGDPDDDFDGEAYNAPNPLKSIVSMERGETSGSKSPMWRCTTIDGEKVNVFKHSDPDRDTFHLFREAGYDEVMMSMKVGDVLTWKETPISATMSKSGGWWEVTRVYQKGPGDKPEIGRDDAKAKAEAAAWAKGLIESGDFVVLDTETTGLDRTIDEPVSIAIVSPDGTVLLDTLVKPYVSIHPDASAIHGISQDKLSDAPMFSAIHGKLFELLGDHKNRIVVYNAEFDNAMLINATNAAKLDLMAIVGGGWYCAMEQYAKFYGEWNPHHANYKNQSLTKALEQQGIESVGTLHSAVGDCQATLALIKKMAAYDPHPF